MAELDPGPCQPRLFRAQCGQFIQFHQQIRQPHSPFPAFHQLRLLIK